MNSQVKKTGVALIAIAAFLSTSPAKAYGPEGLFGGRPMPDSSIILGNPVELKNDRPERAESVLEHPRPDYDPAPIEAGSFEIFPSLELGEAYEDNVFASSSGRRDDAVGLVRPVVNVFSNWGRHALALTGFGDFAYYSQHPDENYRSLVVEANGRYDILNQVWIGARGGHQYLAESRTSPNDVNGSEPATFNLSKAGLSFYHGPGLLSLLLDYDFRKFDYTDTPSVGGTIDQSGRSRDEHVGAATVKYRLSGNVSPYVRGSYNIKAYDRVVRHDSDGFDAVVGATMDFGGITSLDVYGGWMLQDYEDFGYKETLSSPTFGARLDWNVTGMTSVVLETKRTIEETSLTGYNSYYATGGSATITHELMRNVILEADATFTRADFNGLEDRQDDIVVLGGGGRYLINRNLYTDLMYSWERRYSTDDPSDYLRNRVMLRLGVRL